jgi:adenylate cyclase
MFLNLRKQIWRWRETLTTAPCVAGLVIAGTLTGFFQQLEWTMLDGFFRHRPLEPIDSRIVLVTIDESDIEYVKKWPISDKILAELIKKLRQQQPRAIGLDIYRNLPVEPGHQDLVEVFKSTPNAIGIKKAIADAVDPSPTLQELGQVALADLTIDLDGKVRRSLISIKNENNEIELGLGTILALMYLEAEGMTLEDFKPSFPDSIWQKSGLKLGKAIFVPFTKNDGGYVRADDGGYQVLLNFRGSEDRFANISLKDVLEDKIPPDLVRDRVVIVGSIAQSLNDFLYTPYSKRTPGVAVHANITSQIISAALEGRPLLKVLPDSLEWVWVAIWSFIGAGISKRLLHGNLSKDNIFSSLGIVVFGMVATGVTLVFFTYLIFLEGWWIPVISPLVALGGSTLGIIGYQVQYWKRTAFMDGLTQIANRRFFEEYLHQEWWRQVGGKQYLSVILCDVDCFKLYNDTYGHQAGDSCLQQVASAMSKCIRSKDLVARYGGEEFVVVLPDTTAEIAVGVAQRICASIKALQIPHAKTKADSKYVTLSCGVASIIPEPYFSAANLISIADQALYKSKEQGRDRVSLAN